MLRILSVVCGLALFVGCGQSERRTADGGGSNAAVVSADDAPPPAHLDDVEPGPPAGAEWVVTPLGAGHVRIGMTLAELAPYLEASVDTSTVNPWCDYVAVAGAPDSLGFMIEQRRLARIDVRGGPTATEAGARIGDPEERILALYTDVERLPHKYTDGYYLVVAPLAPSDTIHRYVFETDGARVTGYRAGVHPQVGWVEGCS